MALSCPIDPRTTQEEMAQSAHLMTLGLCRISATKPPPPPPPLPPAPSVSQPVHPPVHNSRRLSQSESLKQSKRDGQQTRTSPCGKRRLPCLLCPLTLPSRRLLDVHVRSHQASGGFSCVCCSWTAESWEELEPHWKSHCRKRRREEQKQEKKKAAASRRFSCLVCLRAFKSAASRNAHQQTHDGCDHRRHSGQNTSICSLDQSINQRSVTTLMMMMLMYLLQKGGGAG